METPRACPEKLLDIFDSDMLQIFEFERFLFDHVEPRDREALSATYLQTLWVADASRTLESRIRIP